MGTKPPRVPDVARQGPDGHLALRPAAAVEFIQTAYHSLFHVLQEAQAPRFRDGQPVDNYVAPHELPIPERCLLPHDLGGPGERRLR